MIFKLGRTRRLFEVCPIRFYEQFSALTAQRNKIHPWTVLVKGLEHVIISAYELALVETLNRRSQVFKALHADVYRGSLCLASTILIEG